MQNLLNFTYEELESFIISIGEAKFRAKQIFTPMHKGISPADLTNLSAKTKEKIFASAKYSLPKIRRKLISALDGTVKYLFELDDGNCVESVVMKYEHGTTICISSQIGCRMGCAFCASTIGGKVRDLEVCELLGQIIAAHLDLGERIDGIVMMGIGEPLDNYDNVIKFLRLVGHKDALNIGYRHISLSTCGLVDKIYKLADEDFAITLSISLHASSDEIRSKIMPINKRWGIDELLDACRAYYAKTGRRISFEYTLISGENDSEENAIALAKKLNSKLRTRTETMPIHVNLIPVNPVKERDFKKSGKEQIRKFALALEQRGIRATVRRTLGADINASCGQLRRDEMQKKQKV